MQPVSPEYDPYQTPLVRRSMHVIAFLLLIGIPFVEYQMACDLIHARETARWPTAPGVVLRSELTSQLSGTHDSYTAEVEYRYQVGGSTFTGSGTRVGGVATQHKFDAQWIVDHFPVGRQVAVAYNPRDPSESLLQPGAQWVHYLTVVSPILFFLLPVGWFHHVATHRRREPDVLHSLD